MAAGTTRIGLVAAILAPILWAAHFLFIYVLNALACERAIGKGSVLTGIALATAIGAAALAVLFVMNLRRARLGEEAAPAFTNRLGLLICGITFVALAWNALPVLLVPACGV